MPGRLLVRVGDLQTLAISIAPPREAHSQYSHPADAGLFMVLIGRTR